MTRLLRAVAFFALLALPARAEVPAQKPEIPAATQVVKPDPTTLSLESRLELNRQARVIVARRCAAEGDILGWGKALFPHIFNLQFCHELHDYLISIRHEEFTSTEAPRGHAKTTIRCFLIPLFQALNEPERYWHYLNVQATDEKAIAINRSIKTEVEENAELREIYGDVRGGRWTDGQFVLSVKGKTGQYIDVIFTAKSAGQSIRGIHYRQKRPDYIMVDDLYNEEDLNNPESTEKKNAWFKGALLNCRAKSRKTSVSIQGTAINRQDMLEVNKKNAKIHPSNDVKEASAEGRWVCRTFKAVKDWDAHEVLWKELNNWDALMGDFRDLGSFIFAREMQNERWDEVSAIVKRSWLYPTDGSASWEFEPGEIEFKRGKLTLVSVRIGNDPSIGATNTSDFNGVALVWVARSEGSVGNQFYIVDVWNEHLTMEGRKDRLVEIAAAQPDGRKVTQVRIEGVAGFNDYVAFVKAKTSLPVKRVPEKGTALKDKITILQNKSKYFENRKVFLSKRIAPALKDLVVAQMTSNYPKHDDVRDAILITLDDAADWAWVS